MILRPITRFFRNFFNPDPPVTRVYHREFGDRSRVIIRLSTWHPRFTAEFSEAPSSVTREEYLAFRAECLEQFSKLTGVDISGYELERESFRPLPELPPRCLRDEQRKRIIVGENL